MNQDRLLQVILAPIVTEKTTNMQVDRQYAFKVQLSASKREIKKAIELLFSVEVEQVRVVRNKSVQTRSGFSKQKKKAYVKLKQGHVIQLSDHVPATE